MKPLKISGYAIVGLAVTVSTAAMLWLKGDGDGHVLGRASIVAMVGAAFVLFRSHAMAAWVIVARSAPERVGRRYTRNAEARIGSKEIDKTREYDWTLGLIDTLSTEHNRAWREATPWLLVTGDDAMAARLLPQLVKQGWLVTPDIVLLWKARDDNHRIDPSWLAALRKLRPAHPIDAIVMLVDESSDVSTQRHGTHPWSAMLVQVGDALRWNAPLYALEVGVATKDVGADTPVIGTILPSATDAAGIEAKLIWLRDHLGDRGVTQLATDPSNSYGAKLSRHLDSRSQSLSVWLGSLGRRRKQLKLRGVFFTPGASEQSIPLAEDMPIWRYLGDDARLRPGRKIDGHAGNVLFRTGIAACAVASCAVLVAGISNVHALQVTRQVLDKLDKAPDAAARIYALLALQQRIGFYEDRIEHGVPIWSRLGLNQDKATLDLLWHPYGAASAELLVAPIKQHLEDVLQAAVSATNTLSPRRAQRKAPDAEKAAMPVLHITDRKAHDAVQRSASNRPSPDRYPTLKAYLMLSEPSRVDSAFLMPMLAPILAERWPQEAGLLVGEGLDVSDRMMRFYTQHLPQHPAWRIDVDTSVVKATQASLLSTHQATRSLDTVYREMLNRIAHRYPDQTLASLMGGKDASGLFRTAVTVPGVFTRAAYDGAIAKAIDLAAAGSTVPNDWVLGTDGSASAVKDSTAHASYTGEASGAAEEAAFKATLSDRYFSDYADHWQAMMNSLQWEAAPKMSVALDQLRRLTDSRHSPLIALMTSLAYQGSTGGSALPSLPNVGATAGIPDIKEISPLPFANQLNSSGVQHNTVQSLPMHAAFAPIFQLLGQYPANANSTSNASANGNVPVFDAYTDASLARFLDKLTALRLKLQQAPGVTANAADQRTKQMLQALFEGKDPALADAQSYARWAQASLGSEWAGMGDALFTRPIAQLGHQVSQSAQDGLNAAWHQTILATWHRAFAGRYPFAASNNDASIPELVRFIRPDGGLIDNFVQTQLAGMLQRQGDQWVPMRSDAATPAFDPAFLRALNTLQRIATHLQTHGDLQYHFDLQPVPTPGLTDTILLLDGKQLHYFNQRQTWQSLRWPAPNTENPGTRLQWQTINAGTNKNFEFHGRWGWLRMLERADVQPIDDATFKLTWQSVPDVRGPRSDSSAIMDDSLVPREALQPPPSEMTYPISYLMRTDVGQGPLDVLALRGFVLPSRIFIDTDAIAASGAL